MKDLLRIAGLTPPTGARRSPPRSSTVPPASIVLDEAENRMHTAQALLIALALGQLEGAAPPAMAAIG
jgi:hypothetical protein